MPQVHPVVAGMLGGHLNLEEPLDPTVGHNKQLGCSSWGGYRAGALTLRPSKKQSRDIPKRILHPLNILTTVTF